MADRPESAGMLPQPTKPSPAVPAMMAMIKVSSAKTQVDRSGLAEFAIRQAGVKAEDAAAVLIGAERLRRSKHQLRLGVAPWAAVIR